MSSPNFINIIANDCFLDVSGSPIARGTLTVTSVDANGEPIPFHVGGGGLATITSVMRTIVNGSITAPLQLANPSASDISVGYTFEVTDSASFSTTTFPSVAIVADGSGSFDLSTLTVGSYATAVPVAYATGPQGVPGQAASVTVGTTTTLTAGSSASVVNVGTASAAVLNFGIPRGADGASGSGSGTVGPKGDKGDDGLSAYQVAVADGFIGTEAQWLASLVGTQGIPGTSATPNTASTPLVITGNVISIPAATNSVNGYLTAADHTTFTAKQNSLGFTPLNPANNLSEVTAASARTNLGLATVAATGAYSDLTGKPTLPSGTVTSVSSADANATVATGASTPVITVVAAPKLATARTINGVAFDGTANITVTAAAGTLTGTALPAAVIVPASQVSGLATSATTDATNATNITTGTLNAARLPSTVVVTGTAASGQFSSSPYTLTDASTIAINWSNGLTQKVTIGASRTITFSGAQTGARYLLEVTQGTGGSFTITWPTIRWQGGTAPTLTTTSGKTDLIVLLYDGTDYFGQGVLNF